MCLGSKQMIGKIGNKFENIKIQDTTATQLCTPIVHDLLMNITGELPINWYQSSNKPTTISSNISVEL